jgi:hypothetical protein
MGPIVNAPTRRWQSGARDAAGLPWLVVIVRVRSLLTVSLAPLLVFGCPGCSHVEPPAPDSSPSVALPEIAPPQTTGSGTAAAPPAEPSLPAPDPASLPQTHDVPHAQGAGFEARRDALWDAIVNDDPDRAMPFFFPLAAYRQVKDVTDPSADWKHRLVAAYRRDIHALHARLGDAASAKLLGMEVPETRARWVEPGEEWNKIGYYRVFGSKLRYSAGGEERSFDVKSLISWRGEWFVVHLSAIG